MACGVHLGIWLICLLQAEHVRCLWATQEQSSKTQNSDRYAGFLQQDGGLRRLGGSYPQDQFRQDSFSPAQSSSSIYSKTAVGSGYTNQRLSQPAQGGYAPARFVQSSTELKPNLRPTHSKQVNSQKHSFGLSTVIASGSSVSKYNKRQASHSEGRRKSWPAQQGTRRPGQYQPSSSASVQSPSRERGYYSQQSVAQPPRSAAAKTPARPEHRGYSSPAKTSSLFSSGALPPPQQQTPVKMQTSAKAPARRVISQRRSKAGYKPTSTRTSSHVSYSHSAPAPYKQAPSRTSSVQAFGRSMKPAQGAGNVPAGASTQRFAPTKTHSIPERFGGFAIRRLKDPVDEEKVGVQKPQGYTAPSPPTYRPQAPQQAASYRPQAPQQSYRPQAPQQAESYRPQAPQQSYRPQAPQQAASYRPQASQTASYRPQAPQQAASYRPQASQTASYRPQASQTASYRPQASQAPQASRQAAAYRPQAPSVHQPSTWKKIKPGYSQVLQVQ